MWTVRALVALFSRVDHQMESQVLFPVAPTKGFTTNGTGQTQHCLQQRNATCKSLPNAPGRSHRHHHLPVTSSLPLLPHTSAPSSTFSFHQDNMAAPWPLNLSLRCFPSPFSPSCIMCQYSKSQSDNHLCLLPLASMYSPSSWADIT